MIITTLQELVPHRRLQQREAFAIAEQQANRLREQLKVTDAQLTNERLRSIPGILIEEVPGLEVSGASRRVGGRWVILTNADEAPVRQRFTIAHEIKHILDDEAVRQRRSRGDSDPRWLTERICDYFAACLLMPRSWVKRAWTTTTQDERALASIFRVSGDAIRIRLQETGLVDQPKRCRGTPPHVVPLATGRAT